MSGPFTLQLQQFAAKAKERADDVVGLVVVKVSARLDERSPVGDAKFWKSPPPKGYIGGRFRGNWQLGVGTIPAGETGRIDTGGGATQSAIVAKVPEDAAGKVYYLANNVPYARRIEDGWSRQAPAGLVGLTVVEFETFVRESVAALP
jgi:hypothetical protein